MEIVACHCLKCKAKLGRFRNSWNGIGNTYFSPVHPPLSIVGFESTGDIYEAAQGSQIEDSLLQDLACAACQHVLGLRCDSAPDGHLLQQNQLILRLVEMSVTSEGSGAKAKISLMKSYPLTSSSVRARSQSVSRRASNFHPKSPRLLPSISRTPAASSRPSTPAMTPPQVDVTIFKSCAETAINTQKQDIDRLSASVNRIERDMQILRNFMEETRAELASNRCLQEDKTEEDLVNVRGELDKLRQQVNSEPRPVSRGSFELSNRSLDIMAQDVQLVSRKVDEVDQLKRELEQLKARLSSLENATTSSLDETAKISFAIPESTPAECPTQPPRKPRPSVRETRSRRKRNHDEFNEDELSSYGEVTALPAKRRRSNNIPVNKNSTIPCQKPSVGLGQRINAGSRIVIEINSSNGPREPTIHGQDVEAQFKYVENEKDDDCRHPTTPNFATAPSEVEGRRDFTPLPEETSLPLTERILHLNKLINADSQMLVKDVERGRNRASNGLLFTKDGKVDRRSLRFLRDQENQTPSQQLSEHSEIPMLPSIEQVESALKPRSKPHPLSGHMSALVTPRDKKPFKCGSCKRQYASRSGLNSHQDHAKRDACRKGEGNVCPEELPCNMCGEKFGDLQRLEKHRCHGELGIKITLKDRKRSLANREATVAAYEARLADRERLVRHTLDREMSATF